MQGQQAPSPSGHILLCHPGRPGQQPLSQAGKAPSGVPRTWHWKGLVPCYITSCSSHLPGPSHLPSRFPPTSCTCDSPTLQIEGLRSQGRWVLSSLKEQPSIPGLENSPGWANKEVFSVIAWAQHAAEEPFAQHKQWIKGFVNVSLGVIQPNLQRHSTVRPGALRWKVGRGYLCTQDTRYLQNRHGRGLLGAYRLGPSVEDASLASSFLTSIYRGLTDPRFPFSWLTLTEDLPHRLLHTLTPPQLGPS